MFTSIDQVFTSVIRVAGRRLRIALNPEAMALEYSRYKIGFIITDMPHNAWPAPYRNLNNTGKLMLPNYAFPALPETLSANSCSEFRWKGTPQQTPSNF